MPLYQFYDFTEWTVASSMIKRLATTSCSLSGLDMHIHYYEYVHDFYQNGNSARSLCVKVIWANFIRKLHWW